MTRRDQTCAIYYIVLNKANQRGQKFIAQLLQRVLKAVRAPGTERLTTQISNGKFDVVVLFGHLRLERIFNNPFYVLAHVRCAKP